MRGCLRDLGTMVLVAILLALLIVFANSIRVRGACQPEPESPWAPAGYVCPPIYGTGTASTWAGPGVARNDCTFPWINCEPITITFRKRSVTVTPTMWCHCWIKTQGPNGEGPRIIDLDPDTQHALGIPGPGLWRVLVEPAVGLLPNTSVR